MVDLNLIFTFLWVAKLKSLKLVAQKFSVTQPALSQRIKQLETQVGKSLFLRKQGMELNPAGKELYELCEGYLKSGELIEGWIASQKGTVAGSISITTTHGPVRYVFPDFLGLFFKKYPFVKVACRSVETSPMVEDEVLSGKTDIGMIVGNCQKPSLKSLRLIANNSLLMACSPSYHLAGKPRIGKEDISAARLILHSEKTSRTMQKIFKMLGVSFEKIENVLRLPDMESCKTFAMKGMGVAFVAKMYIQDELKRGELVALPGFKLTSPFYLISRNEKYESSAMTAFKTDFAKYCRELDRKWGEK